MQRANSENKAMQMGHAGPVWPTPGEPLCRPALKVMDGAWAPSSAGFRLPTTSWRTWGGQVLTITPLIVVILQVNRLVEIAGNVSVECLPCSMAGSLWRVLSTTHQNKDLTSLFLKLEVSLVLMENRHDVAVAWSLMPG